MSQVVLYRCDQCNSPEVLMESGWKCLTCEVIQ